ncbi:hypothetical protein [Limnoglobus roseus]|uniref:hypothetical protein n=1 Tax=Limnoglobus roseus TaxID=2598579 RepID=UPI0011EB4247|nr:hypothetical protein [Limnoglobus roseus]
MSAAADVFPPAEAAAWYAWRVALAKRREEQVLSSYKAAPAPEARAAIRNRLEAEIESLEWNRTRVAARDPKIIELANWNCSD